MPPDAVRIRIIHASDPPPSAGPSPVALEHIQSLVATALCNWAIKPLKNVPVNTHERHVRDVVQFLDFAGIRATDLHELQGVRPKQVAAWRAFLRANGASSRTIRQKMTALHSLCCDLEARRYILWNPVDLLPTGRSTSARRKRRGKAR